MNHTNKTGQIQPESRRPGRRRWVCLAAAAVLLALVTLLVVLSRPSGLYAGSRTFSLSLQKLPPGLFDEDGILVHDGWDGPTGDFTHGQIYGLKFGRLLIRLDSIEDPLAAIRRNLPKSVPGLLRVISSKDSLAKRCAGEALVKNGPAAAGAMPALMTLYEQGDGEVEWIILELAKSAGQSAVDSLCHELGSGKANGRRKAAEALGEIGPAASAGIPFLTKALRDTAAPVVLSSAVSLRKIETRDHGEVEALIALMTSKDQEVSCGSIWALGAFGNDAAAAVPPLLVLLNTADPQTAALIARTLGLIGPAAQRAIPRIIALLDSDNPLTVQFSEEALGRFGTNAAAAIPKLLQHSQTSGHFVTAVAALSAMGGDAMPGLLALYVDGTNHQRLWIAQGFMKQGAKAAAAVPMLLNELQAEQAHRAAIAAQALGGIGAPAGAAIPRLIELTRQDDPQLRLIAAEAIWRIARQTNVVLPVALRELREWAANSNALAGQSSQGFFLPREETAAELVSEIGPAAREAAPFLQKLSQSSYDTRKAAAAKALARIRR